MRTGLFQLDPERAHALALSAIAARGAAPRLGAPAGQPVELLGLTFPNRVGVAAGFDKNALAVDGWFALGFGHVEVGTVTPRPQPGNPPPRMFRLTRQQALINRLGFPNDGVEAVVRRLQRRGLRGGGIVGVNIGKNADTPLERAVDDYLLCLRAVHEVADYVTVNVSSPNTQGLRNLQAREQLVPLLRRLCDENEALARHGGRRRPLLVKLAPDLTDAELADIAAILREAGVDGVIATNTTIARDGVIGDRHADEKGGLSGRPLQDRACAVVATLRAALDPGFPIIGVGGIGSADDARAMRAAGADLLQLYTALVYRGPGLVDELARAATAVSGKSLNNASTPSARN